MDKGTWQELKCIVGNRDRRCLTSSQDQQPIFALHVKVDLPPPPSPPIPHCCLTMSEGFSSEVNEDEKEEYRTWSLSRRGEKSTVGPSRLHPQMLALESLCAMSEPSTHSLPKVDLSNMIIRGSPWDLRTDSIILSKKSCPWESSTPSPPEEYRGPASYLVNGETRFLVPNVSFITSLHSNRKG